MSDFKDLELAGPWKQLLAAQKNGHFGSWEWDIVTNKVSWSHGLCHIFGIQAQEFAGTFESYLERVHPGDRDLAKKTVETAYRALKPFILDERIVRPDGTVRTLHSQGEVIADENGRPMRIVGICQDITERTQIEQQLIVQSEKLSRADQELGRNEKVMLSLLEDLHGARKQLQLQAEELARSNAELEQFAYVASHDLQEPLRKMSSYSQLLAKRYQGHLDENADKFIEHIVDAATRMQALIKALLEYSRVGNGEISQEPVNLESVIKQTLVDLESSILETRATITYDPPPTLMANPIQINQLFQNLIGNAIKFRRQEPPVIHISAKQKDNEWVFGVRDNGIGIDPEYFERIFQIFQRLHSRAEYPGTGIGLAICMKIVERHGGRIWVESEPGKGSAFWFTLATPPVGKE